MIRNKKLLKYETEQKKLEEKLDMELSEKKELELQFEHVVNESQKLSDIKQQLEAKLTSQQKETNKEQSDNDEKYQSEIIKSQELESRLKQVEQAKQKVESENQKLKAEIALQQKESTKLLKEDEIKFQNELLKTQELERKMKLVEEEKDKIAKEKQQLENEFTKHQKEIKKRQKDDENRLKRESEKSHELDKKLKKVEEEKKNIESEIQILEKEFLKKKVAGSKSGIKDMVNQELEPSIKKDDLVFDEIRMPISSSAEKTVGLPDIAVLEEIITELSKLDEFTLEEENEIKNYIKITSKVLKSKINGIRELDGNISNLILIFNQARRKFEDNDYINTFKSIIEIIQIINGYEKELIKGVKTEKGKKVIKKSEQKLIESEKEDIKTIKMIESLEQKVKQAKDAGINVSDSLNILEEIKKAYDENEIHKIQKLKNKCLNKIEKNRSDYKEILDNIKTVQEKNKELNKLGLDIKECKQLLKKAKKLLISGNYTQASELTNKCIELTSELAK